MATTHRAFGFVSAISMLAVIVVGCGSDGPTKTSRQAKDGRIYVRNESSELSLEVTLKYGEQVQTVTVEFGERKEITEDPVEGGTRITLVLEAFAPPPGKLDVQSNPTTLEYEIDGDLTIMATSQSFGGSGRRMDYERV